MNLLEIDGDQIQGIVSLRLEWDEIQGDTPREILQRLHPTLTLTDIQNSEVNKLNIYKKKSTTRMAILSQFREIGSTSPIQEKASCILS